MKENYGRANAKALKRLSKILKTVNDREAVYSVMSDSELQGQTQLLRERYNNGEELDALLPDAYAVCREAARRTLGQRHFDVQVMGGIALHQGRICQMATGEGKTLTETLPAYLNALAGKGVHIVTVNEYLAKRDKDWMGQVFGFLGLTVGVTLSQQPFEEKKAAYDCDITYGTNSEFGFDYLRDNMATTRAQRVQRGLNFVIIDEVDSILIDEARTPLIISGRGDKPGGEYVRAKDFVVRLQKSTNVDVEGNLEGEDGRFARFTKPEQTEEPNGDYVVDEKSNSVRLTARGIKKAEAYYKIDNLSSPENSEINHFINNALRAQALMKRGVDYIVEKGRVVIVDNFTGRKMEGRRFSNGLHQAIEAKENVTIQPEDKTVATITLQNYFRLYHKMSGMTGTAKTEEKEFNTIYNVDVVVIPTNKPVIRIDYNDQFYRTAEGKLRAIVQKIKECHEHGQPVLVGTTSVEKSIALSRRLRDSGIMDKQVVTLLNAKSDEEKEALAIAKAGMPGAITIATNMAGRGTDILLGGGDPLPLAREEFRRIMRQRYRQTEKDSAVVNQKVREALALAMSEDATDDAFALECRRIYRELYDRYAEEFKRNRQLVLDAGGLFVIGTERHEARRIDDQLRGRAGRQGDPGCSMFFVSAEDDMIRVFGDMIQRAMAFVNFDENTPIEMRIITKGVEMAQKRIEGMHFSARKNVLQYDDVNNSQRKVIYKERDRIMDNEDIHKDILAMVPDYARYALAEACDSNENVAEWRLDNVNKVLRGFFVCEPEEELVKPDDLESARHVCDLLTERLTAFFNERLAEAGEGAEYYKQLERDILLRTLDMLWMDHIDALDDLRKGVGLQAIGQHDPLAVYKKEAYELFENLNEQIKVQALRRLMRYRVTPPTEQKDVNTEKKLNGPCPCGSGKKYKNCCYQKDLEKQREQADVQDEGDKPLTKQEIYALKRQQRKADKELKKISESKK